MLASGGEKHTVMLHFEMAANDHLTPGGRIGVAFTVILMKGVFTFTVSL